MSIEQAYLEKMDAELKRFEAEVARVKADAKIKSMDKKAELENRLNQTREKFGALKQAGAQAGHDLKEGFEHALEDLRRGWKETVG